MKVAIVSDHVGLELKRELLDRLRRAGIACTDLGTDTPERCDYPLYAYRAASALAEGRCDRAVLLCGTGVGMSLAANKVRGVRCVVCSEPYSAVLSRRHNDTNALALGARVVGSELAWMILESWLAEPYEGGRHQRRVDQIARIENGTLAPGDGAQTMDQTSGGRGSYIK